MEARHTAWQVIGGALLAVGGAGLIAILIWDWSSPNLGLESQAWFWGLIGVLAVLTLLGFYGLFAPIFGLPLPQMRAGAESVVPVQILGGTNTINLGGSPAASTQRQDATVSELAAQVISDRTVRLVDVPRHGKKIVGKTFRRCTLLGPSVIAPVGKTIHFVGNDFNGAGQPVLWEVPDKTLVNTGCIPVEDCRFEKCHFEEVGIVGTRELIAQFEGKPKDKKRKKK